MNTRRIKHGAPLCLRASRLLFAALLALAVAPLHADGPNAEGTNWLERAQNELKTGGDQSATYAAKALKAAPTGADANRQMAFTLFWTGHFEDASRYMRRALASDRNALVKQGKLGEIMPVADARARLNELAPKAADDPDLCFLTGAMLLVDDDRRRALSFLVRAEELAGTDGQAATLANDKSDDRNRSRGEVALSEGDWSDAVRGFTFAALDAPTVAEHYAGLVIALAADGEDEMALKLASNVYARYRYATLLPWLRTLNPKAQALVDAAKRIQAMQGAGLPHHKLATLLLFTARYYHSAGEAGVRGLLLDKLDDFIHDNVNFMERNKLQGDPVTAGEPETPPAKTDDKPETEPAVPPTIVPADGTLDDARKAIRRGGYTDALKVLDGFTREDADAVVYQLLFVVFVGRGELTEAGTSLQTWFLRASEAERKRLNAIREMFGSKELFEAWRKQILVVRDADPNVGLPRMLNCYVEITRGRYNNARDELIVARIESPANLTVQAMDRLLQREDLQQDVTPDGIPDDPAPKALLGRADQAFRSGDYEAAKSNYLRAMEADPTLPYLTLGLLRCYFALADYDNAMRQLQILFTEQQMDKNEPRDFQLLVDAGYEDPEVFKQHLETLRQECNARPLSTTPWVLYGMVLLSRSDFSGARDALNIWHDNDTAKLRDPILLKFYEYARKRAS